MSKKSPFGSPKEVDASIATEDVTEYDSPSPSPSPVTIKRPFTKTRRELPQMSSSELVAAATAAANAIVADAFAADAAADTDTDTVHSPLNSSPVPVFPKVRRAMPPPLALDPRAKAMKKSKSVFSLPMTPPITVQGMVRVPSSRLANRVLEDYSKQGAFDSPELHAQQACFDSPQLVYVNKQGGKFNSPKFVDSPKLLYAMNKSSRFDSPKLQSVSSSVAQKQQTIQQDGFDSPNL